MNAPRIALPRAPTALFGRFAAALTSSSIRPPCQHLLRRFSQTQSWATAQEKVQTAPSYQPYPLNTRPPTPPRNDPVPETSIAGPIPETYGTIPPARSQQAAAAAAAATTTTTTTTAAAAAAVSPEEPLPANKIPGGTAAGPVAIPEREAQKSRPVAQAAPKRKLRPRKAALKLTPAAVAHLRRLLDQPEPKLIKVGVRNRGCSGLAYHLEYVDRPGPFDEEVEQDGVRVLIDSKALFSIIGSEMDWVEDKLNQRFFFRNPNIKEECGCGESFMV